MGWLDRITWLVLGAIVVGLITIPRGEDLEAKVAAANERAAEFEGRFLERARAYRDLAMQTTSEKELRRSLEEENEALAREINRANGTILSLQRVRASLEARLQSTDTTTVVVSDSTVEFNIFSRREWSDGNSFFEVSGPARVDLLREPPRAETDLTVRSRFGVTTVLDRRGEADLAVSVFTDAPDIFTIDSVEVVNNLSDPLTQPPGFWERLRKDLFGLNAMRHRAEGALVMWLLSR